MKTLRWPSEFKPLCAWGFSLLLFLVVSNWSDRCKLPPHGIIDPLGNLRAVAVRLPQAPPLNLKVVWAPVRRVWESWTIAVFVGLVCLPRSAKLDQEPKRTAPKSSLEPDASRAGARSAQSPSWALFFNAFENRSSGVFSATTSVAKSAVSTRGITVHGSAVCMVLKFHPS